ncbi:MAG: threonine synthase [Gammaproteobacteria bacterium]|nr:threonine synthase [Pseudomonadota bacterium]MCH9663643.1 threonine synthase [Gammaproteobacteria bacterium]
MTTLPPQPRVGIINRWREYLDCLDADCPVISLGEGGTPLLRLSRLPREHGLDIDLYVKYEGLNPTGSFKDRGMTVAVSQFLHEKYRAVICASTGNTSAAAAAYAARAGMRCFVLIPDGKIATGKLAQAMIHDAVIFQIKGNFDDGMKLAKEISAELPVGLVNSVNPFRLQGQKTAAFEICESLESAPSYHALPVGNAGNISSYWLGYREMNDKFSHGLPAMIGYQAAGAAPFIVGAPVDQPETVATAIRIGHPQSWELATEAVQSSSGWFAAVSDEDILHAQRELARLEGVFCEPASAASIAGIIQDVRAGKIPAGARVVCTLTGAGLKDPDTASRNASEHVHIHKTGVVYKEFCDAIKKYL